MELWDAYREDGTLAGCDLIRGEPIPEGLYHLVCEVIVKHKDRSYLIMQRDWNKPNYPGLYEASASGSAHKGESPHDAAVRELKEETGIEARGLKEIYRHIGRSTIYYGYLCETDCDKDSIKLQEGETISYMWLTREEFLEFVKTDKYVQPQKERMNGYLNSIR